MKTFLVGGAVRDKLLGINSKDADYVVIGETKDSMLARGFLQVGRDFPVFLHPKTKSEYALARRERKIASGHQGFSFDIGEDVTLTEDLMRRDLTINAMACDSHGEIIDPFNGQKDLQAKLLRHVSEAFREDPLRILRVARFYARYSHLGFKIAQETQVLMRAMVRDGALGELPAERIYQEVSRALHESKQADLFFSCLRELGALAKIMPELDRLFGVPQTAKYHPEIDTGMHTLMALKAACLLSPELDIRFAALLHDLGKGMTEMTKWPSHHGHDKKGQMPIKALCMRLRVPKSIEKLCVLASCYHTQIHNIRALSAKGLLSLLLGLDVLRQPENAKKLAIVGVADARGRLGYETSLYPQKDYLLKAAALLRALDLKSEIAIYQGDSEAIKRVLHNARLSALKQFIQRESANEETR